MTRPTLGWFGILRLGIVQAMLGAVVVLTTSTMNRVMVVELALPAVLPGALIGCYYAVQLLRPRWGHNTDVGGRRTPWIVGGMIVLALGGTGAAAAIAVMAVHTTAGIVLAALAFVLVGIGVGAAGTSLLALLATRVDDTRRAAAATVVWVTMIVGFVVTTTVAGSFLDPFSTGRLIGVTATVSGLAVALTVLAVAGLERRKEGLRARTAPAVSAPAADGFRRTLADVWAKPRARRFAVFVFVSMLAYSAQDLVLEPFAGAIFGMTPGASTKLAGLQYAGVLAGMILAGFAGTRIGAARFGSLRTWAVGSCALSAAALIGLAAAAFVGPAWPLRATVFLLGAANGAFAVAAIGSMMALARSGGQAREGIRMGLWGAAQAVAFGLGGLFGTVVVDVVRYAFGAPSVAYAIVFAVEAAMFLVAARLAGQIGAGAPTTRFSALVGDGLVAEMPRK